MSACLAIKTHCACEISDTYPLGRSRNTNLILQLAGCVNGCLQTCNLNVDMEVMGLVLGQIWMVIPTSIILLCPHMYLSIIMYCCCHM